MVDFDSMLRTPSTYWNHPVRDMVDHKAFDLGGVHAAVVDEDKNPRLIDCGKDVEIAHHQLSSQHAAAEQGHRPTLMS